MHTSLINVNKDCIMMHTQRMNELRLQPVLNSWVLDKHNILYNAILISIHKKLCILQRGELGRRPSAKQALNVSVATAQVPQLRPFLELLQRSVLHLHPFQRHSHKYLKPKAVWNVSPLTVITTLMKLIKYNQDSCHPAHCQWHLPLLHFASLHIAV